MKWHVADVPFLLTHLPRAVHDLIQHEDSAVVQAALATLKPKEGNAATRHRIVSDIPPRISIEKSLDPMALRSVQNIGLLLHDYIQEIPDFDLAGRDGEKLLEHWRSIMLEHPERLAQGHANNWLSDKTKAYWQERLSKNPDAARAADFAGVWDDWERAAAAGGYAKPPAQMQAMQLRQWQDLVIRSRLHREKAAQYGVML